MNSYIEVIKTAFIFFPIIALVFTMPFMIYQYYKHGAIPFSKTFVVYTFILYLLVIYFLVILPLPPIKEVALSKASYTQLIPFNFVYEIITKANFNNPLAFFKSKEVTTVFFNVLMFIPLGVYLRNYFKISLKKTLLIGFLLSLFFELTQLTGLYFIYPRPYRLFDVDDLIVNTLGTGIGFLIAPLFSKIIWSKEKINTIASSRTNNVSIPRRLTALFIDFVVINIISIVLDMTLNRSPDFWFLMFSYFLLQFLLFDGLSIGKRIVHIKIVGTNDQKVSIFRKTVRSIILYLILIPAPIRIVNIIVDYYNNQNIVIKIVAYTILGIYVLFYLINCFDFLFALFKTNKPIFYERITKTKNQNTLKIN